MADFGASPMLMYMLKDEPDLIQALTGEIVDDLELNYIYIVDAFPRRSEIGSS